MLIFELQNSFPKTAPYKNILTNSYHYSFITSEHYRHNASKQLFNKSACGPIKYNLLYMQYNYIFETPFTTITKMGPPLPTTPDINTGGKPRDWNGCLLDL